jgi:hypothetical protein
MSMLFYVYVLHEFTIPAIRAISRITNFLLLLFCNLNLANEPKQKKFWDSWHQNLEKPTVIKIGNCLYLAFDMWV